MKYIKYTFWLIVAVCLIIVGMANRGIVTLRAMPEGLASQLGISPDIEMPLFMAIFIGVGIGLLIGFMWEWVREHRMRSHAKSKVREVDALKREIDSLKTEKHEGKDEIVALLDKAS
ncbi:LapA family protein [Octadecabacter sp. 1_MG-2023]|uniref:lipopolysaccharide assembly protein LapA domain-containing protein n=1 Tax=unclassified Octadecabacter TaxID=196158 RepID=UPI001C09C439|nr:MULTISPECIES: LapA family protein [unclassified Octadecabacter]MBU2994572.1 LapA family protein [Octadecabacter sp. B2R22]MDO6734135.1 LapA family protein [Octadecabacter sp. 1_MG-2023]